MSQRIDLEALEQRQALLLQKTVNFNIIVVGQSGTGKTTFINTIFDQNCFTNRQVTTIPHPIKVVQNSAILSKKELTFQLSFIDLEGYKSQSCIREWVKQVKNIASAKFRQHYHKTKTLYQSKELYQSQYQNIVDDRIHACLYFINGPKLSQEDLFAIKNLSTISSVIPIIARGDSYTSDEQIEFKIKIKKALQDQHIEYYDCLRVLPEQNKYRNQLIQQQSPPFIMVSHVCKENELGRIYPWGVCQVWNPEHSDLQTLQKLLIGYYSLDMIQLTDYYQHKYIKRKQQKKQLKRQSIISYFLDKIQNKHKKSIALQKIYLIQFSKVLLDSFRIEPPNKIKRCIK